MSLQKDIESLAESVGLKVYDISVVNDNYDTIYRINVVSDDIQEGKRKSVTLDECVNLSHLISPLLDVTPPVSGEYRLEVGSPGIEKKITLIEQFELCIGEDAQITLKTKEKISGKIAGIDGSKIMLDSDEGSREIDFTDISKAKTYFEW